MAQHTREVPTVLIDADVRVKPRLIYDREEAQREYERFGEWWERLLEDVRIDRIQLPPVWAPERLENNLYLLRVTGAMPPVWLTYNEETDVYEVSDGVHRIHAAKQRGYLAVPAVVSYRRTTPPP